MSDKKRWRYGDTNAVMAAVDPSTVIEIGDLLWQDVDDAKPASALLITGGESRAERFAAKFLGVAMQRSRNGETAPVRVATTGRFDFDCRLGSFQLGDLVGVPVNDTGKLQNQAVVKVSSSRHAIGRVAKREAGATVLVEVRSTVMTGGIEGSSPSGM